MCSAICAALPAVQRRNHRAGAADLTALVSSGNGHSRANRHTQRLSCRRQRLRTVPDADPGTTSVTISPGQPAPRRRFPQPASRCAHRGRPKILSRWSWSTVLVMPDECAGAKSILAARDGPAGRARSSRRLVPARWAASSPPGPGISCCLAGSPLRIRWGRPASSWRLAERRRSSLPPPRARSDASCGRSSVMAEEPASGAGGPPNARLAASRARRRLAEASSRQTSLRMLSVRLISGGSCRPPISQLTDRATDSRGISAARQPRPPSAPVGIVHGVPHAGVAGGRTGYPTS